MTEPESKRIDFEAKVAFLERSVELMNETILEQNKAIQQLTDRLIALERDLADDETSIAPHDAPPPHY